MEPSQLMPLLLECRALYYAATLLRFPEDFHLMRWRPKDNAAIEYDKQPEGHQHLCHNMSGWIRIRSGLIEGCSKYMHCKRPGCFATVGCTPEGHIRIINWRNTYGGDYNPMNIGRVDACVPFSSCSMCKQIYTMLIQKRKAEQVRPPPQHT